MPAPLSLDLRRRIFEYRQRTGATLAETAERFAVGEATVNRLFARQRATGALAPKTDVVHGPPPRIADDKLVLLRIIVEANNDATVNDICDRWFDRTDERISRATMTRSLVRAGLTLKKSRAVRRNASARTSSKDGADS